MPVEGWSEKHKERHLTRGPGPTRKAGTMTTTATHPLVAEFLRATGWQPTTVRNAVSCLDRWGRFLDARGVDLCAAATTDTRDYLEGRADTIAAATLHVEWRNLKALYAWLVAEGDVESPATRPLGPMHGVKAPRVHQTPVKVIDEAEFAALLKACSRRTEFGRRDEAILLLMFWTGLRRSEVAHLDLDALDLDARRLTIGSVKYATKTKSLRRVPITADTASALARYLRKRGHEAGPLFVSKKAGPDGDYRLRPNSITLMLKRLSERAGLGRVVGAHEFRRAFATNLKRRGGSDSTLMAVGGWSDLRQVLRYTRMDAEDLSAEEFHRLDPSTASRRRGPRPFRAAS